MRLFSSLTIKARLALLAMLAVSAAIIVGVHSLHTLATTNQRFKSTFEDRVIPLAQLKTVADMYAVNIVDTAHKVRNGNLDWEAGAKNIDEAQLKIGQQWQAYMGTYLTDREKGLATAAESKMKAADASIKKLKNAITQKDRESLAEFTIKELYPAIDPVSGSISDLVDLQLSEAKKEYELAARDYAGTRSAIIVWIVLAALICAVFAFGLTRAITSAIGEAVDLSRRIASGDLTSKIPAGGKDEIGALLLAFDSMQERLRETIGSISQGAAAISDCAAQLSNASEIVANGSREQSDAAATMAAAVEEMTVSIGHVAASANDAHSSARENGRSAQEGGQVVMSAADEMSVIALAVNESAGTIEALGEHSIRISTVLDVIKDIADQTNLLALNAAIEAARAGDQGRGFSVVADEVRKLAERTAGSTQEITAMVSLIQSDTARAVEGMRQGNGRVSERLEMARMAGESIGGITLGADRVVTAVGEISSAMQAQRTASEQIAQNVEKIAHMAEENSNAVQQMAGTAKSMNNLAQELRDMMQRFKI